MGQPVQIVARRFLAPAVVRYEIDRSLTGTGHETYSSPRSATGDRPSDVLARRLFETGHVSSVHVFSNLVTVTLHEGSDPAFLDGLVRDLFIHYRAGVEPTAV